MQRRAFLLESAASIAATALILAGCSTSVTPTTTTESGAAAEKRRRELDLAASRTIDRLFSQVQGSRELVNKASGVLVFPSVIAAGLAIGGQYGEGELRVGSRPVDYYSLASASIGLQIGAQSKAIIFLFMTPEALNQFRQSEGWSAGVDASVAVLKVGANGVLDTSSVSGPVLAFVLTNEGLMANLSLQGTKISKLKI